MIHNVRTGSGIWWASFSKNADAVKFAYNNETRFKNGLYIESRSTKMPPCSDSRCYEDEKNEEVRVEARRLVVLLCAACNILKRYNYNFKENPELDEWMSKHLRIDKIRKQD